MVRAFRSPPVPASDRRSHEPRARIPLEPQAEHGRYRLSTSVQCILGFKLRTPPKIQADRCLLFKLEQDVLRALPQRHLPQCRQVLAALGDRQEMIAGELSDLAGKRHRAIGEQNFRFTDAARIKDNLARGRMARGILITQAEIELAERYPAALAAPAHVDDLLPVWQQG